MRFSKNLTRLIASALSCSIAAGPAVSAEAVYRIYVPGLTPAGSASTPDATTPLAETLPQIAPAALALSTKVGDSTYQDITVTLPTPGTWTWDTAQLPSSVQLLSNSCGLATINSACSVRVLYTPSAPEDQALVLPWSSGSRTGSVALQLHATAADTPVAELTLPVAFTSAQYTASMASDGVWTPQGPLPAGLSFENNTLAGVPLSAGSYVIDFKHEKNGVVSTHHVHLPVQSVSAQFQGTTVFSATVGIPLAQTLSFVNTGSAPLATASIFSLSSPDMSVSQAACPALLNPGQACDLVVGLSPVSLATSTATLSAALRTPVSSATRTGNTLVSADNQDLLALGSAQATLNVTVSSAFGFVHSSETATLVVNEPFQLELASDLTAAPNNPSWSTVPALPTGLAINTATGTITGTSTQLLSPWSGQVQVSSADGSVVSKDLTILWKQHNVSVSTTQLDFGAVAPSSSKALAYLVTNTGDFSESIGVPVLYGASSASTLTTNCPTSLLPTQSCLVQVSFAPDDAQDSLLNAYVQFEGAPLAALSLWAATAQASTTSVVPTVTVSAYATSSTALTVPPQELVLNEPFSVNFSAYFSGVISGAATWALDTTPPGLVLDPATGILSGTPTASAVGGTETHTLTVAYRSSPLLPLQRLTAAVVFNTKDYSWTLSKSTMFFDNETFEGQSAQGWLNMPHVDTVVATNTGNQPLDIKSVLLSATDQATIASFATLGPSEGCTATVAPGSACTLTLTYTPTSEHASIVAPLSLSSGRYTKTVNLDLRALNPLNLSAPVFDVYKGSFNKFFLDDLLTVGPAAKQPATPASVGWSTSGADLPVGLVLDTSSRTIQGLVTATAQSTQPVLSASYANNKATTSAQFRVHAAVLSVPADASTSVWQTVPTTYAITLSAPATNTGPLTVSAPVSISGQSHAALTLTPTHNCTAVAPGASCTLSVQILAGTDPTVVGMQSASFAIPVSYGGQQLITPVALSVTVKNPLQLTAPAALQLLRAHPLTAKDFSSLASYLPAPATNTDLFTWSLTPLPAGLSFDANTQQLAGTPAQAGTTVAQLQIAYRGLIATQPLQIQVQEPTIESSVSSLDMGSVYLGTSLSKTVTFTLPNGGQVTNIPAPTLAANQAASSTTCTTGLKVAGYSCTFTLTAKPFAVATGAWSSAATLTLLGASKTVPLTMTIANPLALPDQEAWQIIADQSQTMENFASLLTDARGGTSTVTWTLAAPSATTSAITSGTVVLSAPKGTGTFTVTASRNGATVSKTYNYSSLAWPFTTSSVTSQGFFGYKNNSTAVQTLTNTSASTISTAALAPIAVDLNVNDKITPSISAQTCSSKTLAPAATCTITVAALSQDTSPTFDAQSTFRFYWTPQPATKPSRVLTFTQASTTPSVSLVHPLSWTTINPLVLAQNSSVTIPLAGALVNAVNPAQTYTWTASGLPTGLAINATTGVISGATSIAPGTYTASITASYTSPFGLLLTTTTPITLNVVSLAVKSSLLDFGLIYPQSGPQTKTVTLTNTGTVPVSVTSLTFPAMAQGTLVATPTACAALAVGASCTATVTLTPGSLGVLATTGIASLTYNSLSAQSTVPAQAIVASPLSLDTKLPPSFDKTPYSTELGLTLSHYFKGNNPKPSTWTAASLPQGWTLSASGTLAGTPAIAAPPSFAVNVQNDGYSASATYPLQVLPVSLTASGSTDFGMIYSNSGAKTLTVQLTNTTATVLNALSAAVGTSDPDIKVSLSNCTALSANASCSLQITFNPTTPVATYANTIKLSYGVATGTHTLTLPISAAVVNPLALAATTPLAIKGLPYRYNLQSSLTSMLEPAPVGATWTLHGTLPAGLTFDSTTGIVSGTPSQLETKEVTLTAAYKGNIVSGQVSFVTGDQQLAVSPAATSVPTLYQGAAALVYPVVISNQSVRADTLQPIGANFFQDKAGLQLSSSYGNVTIDNSGCSALLAPATSCTALVKVTPLELGTSSVAPFAALGSSTIETARATATFDIKVLNPLTLAATAVPPSLVNKPFAFNFAPFYSNALNPAAAATWSATGLPPGVTINPATGALSGTPTAEGDFSVQVTVTSGISSISQAYSLRVVSLALVINPAPVAYGTVATNWETPSQVVTLTNPTAWPQVLGLNLPAVAYLTKGAQSTCAGSLAPMSSCTLELVYSPKTVADDLAHNLVATVSVEGFSQGFTARVTGTAINPLSLVGGLPPAFVGVPLVHSLQDNNLRPAPSTGLDVRGISWANSNPIIDPVTGVLKVTPLNTNPIKATAKVALRGNTAAYSYVINPIAATFALVAAPTAVDFGTVYANNGSNLATITLTNTGTYSAEITGTPSFSYNTAAHPFEIKASTCGTEVAPGATCSMTIAYTPTAAAASVASSLAIPVGKYGYTTSTTKVAITAKVLNPLALASTLVQPIVNVPHSQDFNKSLTSLIDPNIDTTQVSWAIVAGSFPAGLSLNNGVVSGVVGSTASSSVTLAATYKGNSITRTFVYNPTAVSAAITPAAADFGIVYPGQVKTQLFTVTNTSANQAMTIEAAPVATGLPADATLTTNCTQGRSIAPAGGCTVAVRYAPTAPAATWSAMLQLGVGRNGTVVQTMTAWQTGQAPNAVGFAAVPDQQVSRAFPFSLDLRSFVTVASNPAATNASITWTTTGSLPAGLSFSNGIITGTATTVGSSTFQVSAAYAGSSASSNSFVLNVVEPVVFVPPPSEPSFYASALSPAGQGSIFVDQVKTFATEWRVNVPATITSAPFVTPGAVNSMSVVWHNCAAVGTAVPAGYTCQAVVQFTGSPTNIGNRSAIVRMAVGVGTTSYAQANAYFTGTVLNPLAIYAQEQIWGLAANTPLVPVSDVFVDRFPNGTPVTVTLTPDVDYRSNPSPSYPSSTPPAYLSNGFITQGPLAESRGIYNLTLTVTKHTTPALTVTTPIQVRIRRHSEFSSVVTATNGLWEGYPDAVISYTLTNTHNIPITPVSEGGGWSEVDFNTADSISSSAATDCLRTLATGASCTYTRSVNPGNAGPNEQGIFGMRTTFRYAPQPATKPSQTVLATHPLTLPASPGSAGGTPTFDAKGMSSSSTVGQTLVYQDLGPYVDQLAIDGAASFVLDGRGCNSGPTVWWSCKPTERTPYRLPDNLLYPYVLKPRGGFTVYNNRTKDYSLPNSASQLRIISGNAVAYGIDSQTTLDRVWNVTWTPTGLTASLTHHTTWPKVRPGNLFMNQPSGTVGSPVLEVRVSGVFPSGKSYQYAKQGLGFRDATDFREEWPVATDFAIGGFSDCLWRSYSFLNNGTPHVFNCGY